MKADRAVLLWVCGAVSTVLAFAAYMILIFARYDLGIPNLADGMWFMFILIPAIVGGFAAISYPIVQRTLKIRSTVIVSLLIAIVLAFVARVAMLCTLGLKDAVNALLDLDTLIWFGCTIFGALFFNMMRVLSGDTRRAEAEVIGKLRNTLGFVPDQTETVRGIAMVLDLQGFAEFFNQPWAKSSVPRYLDLVISALTTELFGGKRFWGDEATISSFANPVHQKFLGDGMLFIWTPPAGKQKFDDKFISELITRVSQFQDQFPEVNQAIRGPIPYSFTLPERVRFGLASGPIYELTRKDSRDKEYMGFCINLASRLQGYGKGGLSILASSRIGIPDETIEELDLIEVVAKNIKGFEDEPILVNSYEFEQLSDLRRNTLFVVEDE